MKALDCKSHIFAVLSQLAVNTFEPSSDQQQLRMGASCFCVALRSDWPVDWISQQRTSFAHELPIR